MPLYHKAPISNFIGSCPNLATELIELTIEDDQAELAHYLPLQGEVTQSFDYADAPGGWHLVWLDSAIEVHEKLCAYVMVSPRWVARPIGRGVPVPVFVRWVFSLESVQVSLPDLEDLPMAGGALGMIIDEV